MRKILSQLLLLAVLMVPLSLDAQQAEKGKKNLKQRKKELAKKAEQQEADKQSVHNEALKRHMDIQTKEVRKRMKKSQKRAKRNNTNKREPFYKRWFRKH